VKTFNCNWVQGDVGDFGVALEAAGYRGDRLSIWGLQVPLHAAALGAPRTPCCAECATTLQVQA
jgi:hypothetical protein